MAEWYRARGDAVPAEDTLPGTGLIVPGVAAGFLFRTDSAFCLLDGFVTSRDAPAKERHRALGAIVDALTEEAKALGFRCVVGLTRSSGMAKLVRRRQFSDLGRYVMLQREA